MLPTEFGQQALMAFFKGYAYQPMKVYGFITLFMFASSFGLPVPEELVLISAGLIAYMALHPDTALPPGTEVVDLYTLMLVCFLAVFLSDLIVYLIGKFFGGKIIKTRFFQKQIAGKSFDTINGRFQKYGGWACGIFRFTPGLRFPGHLSCGLLGIPVWKFVLVDGLAALLSVPTQVYFVATYGEIILDKLAEFKLYVGVALLIFLAGYLTRKVYLKQTKKHL